MIARLGCAALLLLPMALSGCRSVSSPDPLGLQNRSMLSGLVSTRGGRSALAAGRGPAMSGDPFIESAHAADREASGHASVSDAVAKESNVPPYHDAADLATRSGNTSSPEVMSVAGEGRQSEALVQSAKFEISSAATSTETSAMQQRLRKLEWELQFTEDHAAQDQLALEIASLRKQLSRSRR